MNSIVILNFVFVFLNFLLAFHLNNTVSFIISPVLGPEWYFYLVIIIMGLASQFYFLGFYGVFTFFALCLRYTMLPINIFIFLFLVYVCYLDEVSYYSEVLALSGLGLVLIKNSWTIEQKE